MKFILYSCDVTVLQDSFTKYKELLAGANTDVYLLSNVTNFDGKQVSSALGINTLSTIYLIPESLRESFTKELKQFLAQKPEDFLTQSEEILWKSYEQDSLTDGQEQALQKYIVDNVPDEKKEGKSPTNIIFSDFLEVEKKQRLGNSHKVTESDDSKKQKNARGQAILKKIKISLSIVLFVILLGIIGRQNWLFWKTDIHSLLTTAKKDLTRVTEICSLPNDEAETCEETDKALRILKSIEDQIPKCSSTCTPQGKAKETSQDQMKSGGKGPDMVEIPAGCFCPGENVNQIHLKRFAISKYEITFAEYDRFFDDEATKRDKPTERRDKPTDNGWGRENRPVIGVSWRDAVAYTHWLSEQTRQNYRLPTEAEWEYAARAGKIKNEPGPICSNNTNCNGCGSQWDNKTAPVNSFAANPFGLYGTVGNVRELTCSTDKEPQTCVNDNVGDGVPIIVRGSSWRSTREEVRVTSRDVMSPTEKNDFTGFRVIKEIKE